MKLLNPSHSRLFGAMLQWWQRAVLWRRRSGIWEESLSGQVKVQWLTLCYSSLRLWSLCCCGRQHGIHISRVSPENANYGRNQMQTHANSLSLYIFIAHCCIEEWNWKEKCEILAQKKYKSTSATNPTTFSLHIVHFHCTLLHWRMKLEGRNAKYWPKRNTSQQPEQIQLYFKPPERWPNQGMTVRRP